MRSSSISTVTAFFVHAVFCLVAGDPAHRPTGADGAGQILLDLTYDVSEDSVVWPAFKKFEIASSFEGVDVDGVWKSAKTFCSPEHAGTHIDAPSHFHEGAWSVDQIPIENLIGPAIKVDISDKVAAGNVDAQLTAEDLLGWEEKHGLIPNGSIVFMYSGWGTRWHNSTAYYGDDTSNKTAPFTDIHFPGFHPEATRWLISNRTIVGIGVDTASTDYGQSRDYMTHQIASRNQVYGLENVKGLDRVPAVGSLVYVFPMKIRGGTGAPCRIIVNIANQMSPQSAALSTASTTVRTTPTLHVCIAYFIIAITHAGIRVISRFSNIF